MKKPVIKRMITWAIILISVLAMSISAFATTYTYSMNMINKTEYVTKEQYAQFISTLRGMADAQANGDYRFRDTGIVCGSYEEARTIADTLDKLFLGDVNKVAVEVSNNWSYAEIAENPDSPSGYMCKTTYDSRIGGNSNHIYVAFYKGADGVELMRRHDAAEAVIDSVVAAAPEGLTEKCKYFNDWLAEHNSYDYEGYNTGINTKHSVYDAVCEGCSVCSGYAGAFFSMCYKANVPAAYISCRVSKSDGTDDGHAINAVLADGEWKKIDTCWNDTGSGVRYTYFMIDLSDNIAAKMNDPYCTVTVS